MGIVSQIQMLIRGRTRALGRGVVDQHGLEIAEQAIHETEQALVQARHELASVVIQRRRFEQEASRLAAALERRDADGREAVAGGHAELARRVARDVAGLQAQREQAEHSLARIAEQETLARDAIKRMVTLLEQSRAEYRTLRSLDSAARAQALSGRATATVDRRLDDLQAVMQRVRELQGEGFERASTLDEIDRELRGDDLEDALREAGVGGRRQAVDAILDGWTAFGGEPGPAPGTG